MVSNHCYIAVDWINIASNDAGRVEHSVLTIRDRISGLWHVRRGQNKSAKELGMSNFIWEKKQKNVIIL